MIGIVSVWNPKQKWIIGFQNIIEYCCCVDGGIYPFVSGGGGAYPSVSGSYVI